MHRVFVTIAMVVFATPVIAQSSLGIQGLDLRFAAVEDEGGKHQIDVQSRLDVAITDVHGFQGDVAFSDTQGGLIGHLGAHLFMTPKQGQKYGAFASLSDVDGRTMTWGSIGVEGMLALTERTSLEGRAGMGISDVDSLDYIFGDVAVSRTVFDDLILEAALTLTDFDETSFRAMSYETSLSAQFNADGAPWGFFATISHSGLHGRDGVDAATRVGLGITISLGHSGGVAPETRPFRTVDPVAPLVRRDLW
ncbi:MAG: hypothetical protein HKP37_04450 [Boseongicola sp.]|nr:hypothetical protein [Boseongicola sp.]